MKIERVKRTPDFMYKKRASSSFDSRVLSASLLVFLAVSLSESEGEVLRALGLDGDSAFYVVNM